MIVLTTQFKVSARHFKIIVNGQMATVTRPMNSSPVDHIHYKKIVPQCDVRGTQDNVPQHMVLVLLLQQLQQQRLHRLQLQLPQQH